MFDRERSSERGKRIWAEGNRGKKQFGENVSIYTRERKQRNTRKQENKRRQNREKETEL